MVRQAMSFNRTICGIEIKALHFLRGVQSLLIEPFVELKSAAEVLTFLTVAAF